MLGASASAMRSGRASLGTNRAGTDPVTGAPIDAATVSVLVAVPSRIPLRGLAGLAPTVTITITGSAAART